MVGRRGYRKLGLPGLAWSVIFRYRRFTAVIEKNRKMVACNRARGFPTSGLRVIRQQSSNRRLSLGAAISCSARDILSP